MEVGESHHIKESMIMNQISEKYYKQYEQLINQIITSQHMTFFDKADLIEKMDEDLQKKLAQVKGYDIAC